jgi:two-component system, NtrC family, nitrogen regulation sensor histidine kinase NtrY
VRVSLEGKLTVLLFAVVAAGAGVALAINRWVVGVPYSLLAALLLLALPVVWAAHVAIRPLNRLLRALHGAVSSYRDGDFSLSLVVDRRDVLGQLLDAHNELGRALREQRAHLVQRELLLDTMTQNSPVALALVDAHHRVAYANIAARHLLNDGRTLAGLDFNQILQRSPALARAATSGGPDSLFVAQMEGNEETFHLSQRAFLLSGRSHRLYLIKRMTRELSRQEVATWKKLIRVLSHELNNSLAPIASMAQSGGELIRRGGATDLSVLANVMATIRERAEHLHQFIAGYADFARLPAPQPQPVSWEALIDELRHQQPFGLAAPLPSRAGWFDRGQLAQALINLIKNAHEAGGASEAVELSVRQAGDRQLIEVCDRGPGMSEVVMSQALLPFYSTKRSGTGLGLALVREITEAHGGHVQLENREGGGLRVLLSLPSAATGTH